ncbi:MAG: ATP synthase F1 subunit delta [Bacteroidota bacterium]|nr:ATP synthase F1 subunit delta [Bacteroidota bacterium]
MSNHRTAHRYALAVFGVAEEMNKLEVVSKDFVFIGQIIKESQDFNLFLKNPIITTEKKKRVFSELLSNRVSDVTLKFIILLSSKNREALLPEIIEKFNKLRDEKLGILDVTARTAVKFTSAQELELVRQLGSTTKKKVRVKYILDPSLKGGFTVQFEDTVWNASVQHQLELLKKRFTESVR